MNGVSYSCSDLKFAAVNSEASLPVADSALYLGEIPPYKHEDVSEVIRYLMHNVTDEMHRTHHIFCEMDVLHKEADDLEWKESARWVKYEEDVEDGGERWSKPHVASLSMHALFALKKCVYEGAVLLDIPANDMPSIIDRVIRAWRENCGMSDPEEQELVRKVLLKRHKHLNAKRKYRANQEKLRSSKSLVDQNHAHLRTAKSTGNLKTSSSCSSIDSGVTNGEIGDLNSHSKGNMHFMRKIPKDSEAASMMVGTIDSLTNFYMAFVRLQKSGMIGQLTEVSLPTKFLFILLSPSGYRNEIQEIGRSISTMMIDEIFGEVAYKCRNKTDLIAGIEEFMAQGTVLPPGEWDPKIRIEPPVSVPSQVRQTVSDFSVFIAIIVMSAIDSSVGLDTPKLVVPSEFQPTDPTKRGWVINPISSKNPWWLYIAAVLPALLAAILIFLDQQITSVIVNRRENKLKKGGGYHLDMLIVAILVAICSVFGLPWYVAATVSALAHIMSLKKESKCNAPGERPTFLGVREQRVTGTLVGILSGVSVLLTSILQIIPMPVLYGVFLYMGIVALSICCKCHHGSVQCPVQSVVKVPSWLIQCPVQSVCMWLCSLFSLS
ncbi:SLC4A8 [Acanthosepion pharaonis]|uniref:SLC4A8 n=1 Tax=Acanthosepion pharaonis TaxID=158019 RepID=A0A812D619_ACAPH|nr:SLC4A8 [Sepia pharaonis]